jgi:ribonuclease P/MRP protein subunit POP3
MSDKAARTYTHASNRAKPLEPGERKVVFKSSLDNPFRIQWYALTSYITMTFDMIDLA